MASRKKGRASSATPRGPHSYDGLDRVLHEKARLGILTALVTRPAGVLFNDLKQLCNLTDGNLSRHLKVLQDAQLIEAWKGSDGGRPQTLVRLSKHGRAQFLSYLEQLEQVIRDAKRGATARGPLDAPTGWQPA